MSILRKKVFISYRREDTGPAAGRVYDRLSRILSKSNVFFDVSTIGGGENFETTIVDAIARSDAALIFIGEKWLQPGQPTGKARVWEVNDYVRAELRAALARPILVLPVLVGEAEMPKAEQLPEDVKAITTKNALSLRHESFDDDTEHILATLLGVSAKERPWEDKGTIWSKIAYAIGGAITASILMLITALIHYWILARPLSASVITVARRQETKTWELRAAMSMARLWRDQGKREQAHALLAPIYGWFTEGFETRDLKEAKALINALSS